MWFRTMSLGFVLAFLIPLYAYDTGQAGSAPDTVCSYSLFLFDVCPSTDGVTCKVDLSSRDRGVVSGSHAGRSSKATYCQIISSMSKTGQLGCDNWLLSGELRKILLC